MGRLILNSWLYSEREKKSLEKMQYYLAEGDGYFKQQGTRPQSLGFGLGDSPIGLLGWLVEKYHDWMDVENYKMPDDETLTFVMMHWMQAATPGLRFYKAAFAEKGSTSTLKAFTAYLATPLGVSSFPGEGANPPKDWVQGIANLKFHKEHESGGHFPSVECPDALVGDLREWFASDAVKTAMKS